MKADARLEQHYNEWLKEHYGLNNEQEILEAFKENPDLIKDMVDHWEVIKNRW